MRLKSVWISEYKNLRDFTLTFDGHSFLDIFVGKNGTGKSNFFEALVEIFNFVFASTKRRSEIGFDFDILYEINGADVHIRREDGQLWVNGTNRATIGGDLTPDNVIIYYSGHGVTIASTVNQYAKAYARRNRNWTGEEAREFISIGSEYKEMLLSILLMQPEDCAARRYICQKLGIKVTTETVTLRLSPPTFKHKNVEVGDVASFLWGAKGKSLEFVERLLNCVRGDFSRDSIYDRSQDRYSIRINLELFRQEFTETSSSGLFRQFDNLKTLGMFEALSIPIGLADGRPVLVGDFSDGQFQSIYIYAITEFFKDRNCITLLDEPDSFLHPEWQFSFLKQVEDIASTEAAQTNHVLLSSHSASTIVEANEPQIRLFEISEGSVSAVCRDKATVVHSLSAGLITFSEREARLNIYHNLKNTEGPVLLVEGVTDEIIIETAWSKLKGAALRPFEVLSAFSCTTLGRLMRSDEFYAKNQGRVIFALFDWDEAFNEWNMNNSQIIQQDVALCLTKKRNGVDGYNMLLPVPEDHSCRGQVVDAASGQHYANNSSLPIELLFRDAPGLDAYFEIDPTRPGGCQRFKGNKANFAKEVVMEMQSEYFEPFRPVFDFIEEIIG